MATRHDAIHLPDLPAKHSDFLQYIAANPDQSISTLIEPFTRYDNEMRKVFAQLPDHPAATHPSVVPVFDGREGTVRIRARKLDQETAREAESYIMPLKDADRKPDGSLAIARSLQDFKTNFAIFSESSLADLDWSNVVVAGSAVVTSLLAVPDKHSASKRALRSYYHERLAPASDVDLFLYGLSEERAIEKIKQIERKIRDALLVETTTIRTKNAITIVSQYPTRHVQIVLRIYKSISEILTGFDVDCSCAAFDGHQVWASPRALAAYMTQINSIDLTRRSPSYESRLSKYSRRGFEVHWPGLDRSRIDPTIFERSFARTQGLSRLLVLEKLPSHLERDLYTDQRREERGRPAIDRYRANRHRVLGNFKDDYEDEVAEWVDSDEVSDYHTFTIPYGPRHHAKRIEKLLYTKDLLLNADWNKPKDREVYLHRHPAFFGTVDDVIHDCCGYCPKPSNMEEEEVAKEEAKVYISGDMTFIRDDPGRQAIGSFHPLTAEDWTEMAYVGNTQMLCQAIIDGDADYVRAWVEKEDNDPNARDYTGRTPLQLATATSTIEIVETLIKHGARIVARMVDGQTALHIAARRGDVQMISALLRKSEANQEEEDRKMDALRQARKNAKTIPGTDADMADSDRHKNANSDDSDIDMVEDESSHVDATTEASMVNIKSLSINTDKQIEDENEDDPDVYDVDVVAWDTPASALHLAIVSGHIDAVKCLVQEFGANVLVPLKLDEAFGRYGESGRAAVLTLVLSMRLPMEKAKEMGKVLLELGASSAQAESGKTTALDQALLSAPWMLETLCLNDMTGVSRAINHLSMSGYYSSPYACTPLMLAIEEEDTESALKLLNVGAKGTVPFALYSKAYAGQFSDSYGYRQNSTQERKEFFEQNFEQPVLRAIRWELPRLATILLEQYNADPQTLTTDTYKMLSNHNWYRSEPGTSILDLVREKIQELRGWEPPSKPDDAPLPLEEADAYLSAYAVDTFSHWSACKQVRRAQEEYKERWKTHVQSLKEHENATKGIEEKTAAIFDMLEEFRRLERALTARGAKTFKELYPNESGPENQQRNDYVYPRAKEAPFKVHFDFNRSDLSDETTDRYVQLFEAAWAGDAQKVKELALRTWTNSDGEEQPPLSISTRERVCDLSVFDIACLRGKFDLASLCLEIVKVQYVPPGEDSKRRRFRLNNDSEDDESDYGHNDRDDNDVIRITSEIVDDQFTSENIGEVNLKVKSHTQPLHMLRRRISLESPFGPDGEREEYGPYQGLIFAGSEPASPRMRAKRTNTGSLKVPDADGWSKERRAALGGPTNLFQVALLRDDEEFLSFLIGLGQQYAAAQADSSNQDERPSLLFEIDLGTFQYALTVDRPRLLALMIRTCGAGISLRKLANKGGVDIQDRPKHYKGLSVYGKKRKDWANAGAGAGSAAGDPYFASDPTETPPLLLAARHGSIECLEWLRGDAPLRCYMQFAERHKDDKQLQRLSDLPGGFEAQIENLLDVRSHLAIHCCMLLSKWAPESETLLRYLIKMTPQHLEKKNVDGLTPLHVAFNRKHKQAASILLEAGADPSTRDSSGCNLVHTLLKTIDPTDDGAISTLTDMIGLLKSKGALEELFQQRCSRDPGALTPLALWIDTHSSSSGGKDLDKSVKFLRAILDHTDGSEMILVNGQGDTPLHVCVRTGNAALAQVILEHSPHLLHRENATGRTPYEMVRDSRIASRLVRPATVAGYWASRPELKSKDPNKFLKEASRDSEEDGHDQPDLWEVVENARVELEARGQTERRLVTLNEANEVARRLAARNARRRQEEHRDTLRGAHGNDGSDDGDDGRWDEVQHWCGTP